MKIYNSQANKKLKTDLITTLTLLRSQRGFDPQTYIQAKAILLNEYMRRFGLKSCVVAVSGGIDSAVTLGLVQHAAKQINSPIKKVMAVLLPVFSKKGATGQYSATERGAEVARAFDITPIKIDLTKGHAIVKQSVDKSMAIKGMGWADGQLVSYLRTPTLYYLTSLLAQERLPAILCGTTNRDEGAYLGYFGKASDGMVDIQLISDLHKSEVYSVAKTLGVPRKIMSVVPSGDMFDGRIDEEVFGAPYDFVELYMHYLAMKNTVTWKNLNKQWNKEATDQFLSLSARLEKLHQYNLHKYLGKSPAVHLDVYESSVPGGWTPDESFQKYNKSAGNFVGEFRINKKAEEKIAQNYPQISKELVPNLPKENFILPNLLNQSECKMINDELRKQSWVPVGQNGMKKTFDPKRDKLGSYRASTYSEPLADILWSRISNKLPKIRIMSEKTPTDWDNHKVWRAVGVNPLMRFILYKTGGLLIPHYDAPFIYNNAKRTLMSLVIYLTENDLGGGATRFLIDPQKNIPVANRNLEDWDKLPTKKEIWFEINPKQGHAMIFDHRILHDAEILKGRKVKIILRTDIIFEKCGLKS